METNQIQRKAMIEKNIFIHKDKSTNVMNNKALITLEIIVGLLCFVGFFFSSIISFKQFIGKETVTSSTIQKNKHLYLPSVTLCGFNGFKRPVTKYTDLELVKYVNNTVDLDEIVFQVVDRGGRLLKAVPLIDTMYDESWSWKISTTYSAYRGRCYTIAYRRKVYNVPQYVSQLF